MKRLSAALLAILLLLAGCGGSKIDIALDTAPDSVKGTTSDMIVKVTKGDEPIDDAKVSGSLEMAKMDHGSIDVEFESIGNGLYRGQVELPMGGDWIADVEVDAAGETATTILTFEVKER
ncbi:FixH family protein [Sporosarcina sp. FSL W8-0480]|uniref:FixH family protein n=1 Tax=Sporosarcina sp. FSL W8-0480 TaxID=2954701 RepID=UPI0030D89280